MPTLPPRRMRQRHSIVHSNPRQRDRSHASKGFLLWIPSHLVFRSATLPTTRSVALNHRLRIFERPRGKWFSPTVFIEALARVSELHVTAHYPKRVKSLKTFRRDRQGEGMSTAMSVLGGSDLHQEGFH